MLSTKKRLPEAFCSIQHPATVANLGIYQVHEGLKDKHVPRSAVISTMHALSGGRCLRNRPRLQESKLAAVLPWRFWLLLWFSGKDLETQWQDSIERRSTKGVQAMVTFRNQSRCPISERAHLTDRSVPCNTLIITIS